ncbi:MAG TPA: hypothetical protein VIQ74_15615 [Gemmatimonadaceae bacterium]
MRYVDGEWPVMVTDECCDELRRLFRAGVGRNQMYAVRRLVERLAGVVDGFHISLRLSANRPLGHVADDGARMAMRRRRFAGSITHLDH